MAHEIAGRNGTTTIVSDSYAMYGEFQAGPPEPVEDATKWAAKELDEVAACRRYNATPADLLDWQDRFSFPKPCRQTGTPAWGLRRSFVKNYYSLEKLATWDATIADLARRGGAK